VDELSQAFNDIENELIAGMIEFISSAINEVKDKIGYIVGDDSPIC